MGPKICTPSSTDGSVRVSKIDFKSHYVIGKGGFGKVWKVEHIKSKQAYAMKEMAKARILTKKSVHSVMNELNLLIQMRNEFIVNISYAFQDRENIFLLLDLLMGGDLRWHICSRRKFNESQTKFLIACIVSALEYVHSNGIIHRDIKPENIVLDLNGYPRLTDFGIARVWNPQNSQDTSGTPGYMAPEVMCRQNHGVAVDYFAVGIMAYECMMGKRPYLGRNRREIRDQILAKQVQIKRHEVPPGWSLNAADFINKLIQRKLQNRLGVKGPGEVKEHPWLKSIDWGALASKTITAPFLPNKSADNFDAKNTTENWKDNLEQMHLHSISLRRNSIQSLFDGYYYDITLPTPKSPKAKNHQHQREKDARGDERPSQDGGIADSTTAGGNIWDSKS